MNSVYLSTLTGTGRLTFQGEDFTVDYTIPIYGELVELGHGDQAPGQKDLKGAHLEFGSESSPDLMAGGSGILQLDDGRRIGVGLLPLPSTDGPAFFILENEMDLKASPL